MLESAVSFLLLSLLEIVLGIDNIIFIELVLTKVDLHRRKFVRSLGISLAVLFRILLLFVAV